MLEPQWSVHEEILTPPVDQTLEHCYVTWFGGLSCEQSSPRTAGTNSSQVPDTGGSDSGIFHWVHGDPFPCSPCSYTVTFRGIGSVDPDGDIVSWSLDFGDCTSSAEHGALRRLSWRTPIPGATPAWAPASTWSS